MTVEPNAICDECAEIIEIGHENESDVGTLCNECFAELLDIGTIDDYGHSVER